jgi:hypothetical protein
MNKILLFFKLMFIILRESIKYPTRTTHIEYDKNGKFKITTE